MSFLRRLFEQEPKTPDPPEQQIFWPDPQAHRLAVRPVPHTRSDYLGNPIHSWSEKRVTAIWATCEECDRTELRPNHPGRVKGQRSKSAK